MNDLVMGLISKIYQKQNLKDFEVAKKLGVNAKHFSRVKNGKVKPSQRLLIKLEHLANE